MKKYASVFLVLALILSLLTVPSIAAEMEVDTEQSLTTETQETEPETKAEEFMETESSEVDPSEEPSGEETAPEEVVAGTEDASTEASAGTSEEVTTEEANPSAGINFKPMVLTEEDSQVQFFAAVTEVDPGKIYLDNIAIGNKRYTFPEYDLNINTATKMFTGQTTNSGANRYVVYVGETLNLVAGNSDGNYQFDITDGATYITKIQADNTQNGLLKAQFKGVAPGNCTITLKNGNAAVQTFYITVRYPIYVNTALGEYHKDTVHEYIAMIQSWLYNSRRDLFITDPAGAPLYIKNGNDPQVHTDQQSGEESTPWAFPYIVRVGDKVTLVAYADQAGPSQFTVRVGEASVQSSQTETVNGYKKVTTTFQFDTTGICEIHFGAETFYVDVKETEGIHHFDIEVADGATYTYTETTVYSGGAPNKIIETPYDAEITDVKWCSVYNKSGVEEWYLEPWEYWDGSSKESTQHEFTSAYRTNKDRQLVDEHDQLIDLSEKNPVVRWRGVPYNEISRVEFLVDISLIPQEGGDSTERLNFTVPLYEHDMIDAFNKCPGHSGFDFAVNIDEKVVNVVLEGTKAITGRGWDTNLDNGKYNFTLAAVTSGAPMPKTTTVTNVGQNITFPAIEFTKAGTYEYTITESLGTGAPEYVSKDAKEIKVKIVVPESLDNATVTCDGAAGKFTFTNTYKKPTGSLKVTNKVTGEGDQQKDFHYTVELEDKDFNGTINGVEFKDGVGEFDLKHGQEKTLDGLPPGKYTVTESDNEGYTVTQKGDTGTIEANKTAQADFVNHKESTPTGNLTVSNEVKGKHSSKKKKFHYTVELDDDTINGTYGDMEFKNGKAEFDLKHGEKKTATGLPAGVKYKVTESDYDDYTYTSTGAKGTIEANKTKKAHFINTRTEEEDDPTTESKGGSTSDKKKNPKTGDSTNVGFMLALMATGLVGTVVISRRRRKEEE